MNPFYKIFNQPYVQEQAQQYHMNQVWQVQESTRKLKDFLDSLDKIDPAYRNAASQEFCTVILGYFANHTGN